MEGISLVSVNVERSKHLDRVLPFLRELNADVVCVQELMLRDVPAFEEVVGGKGFFSERCVFLARPGEDEGIEGQGIFSKFPFSSTRTNYYAGEHDPLVRFGSDKIEAIGRIARALTTVEFDARGSRFQIATTHFTWTPDGNVVTDAQRKDLEVLLQILQGGEFALCGDFNAPRGLEIFDKLSSLFKDNIPPRYTTSIDGSLHRAGALPFMIDGLFTTPAYTAKNVRLQGGVSDHMAIVAEIVRNS